MMHLHRTRLAFPLLATGLLACSMDPDPQSERAALGPAVTTYQVESLPHLDPGFPYTQVFALGPTGLVVGRSSKDGESNAPVLWNEAGEILDLAAGIISGSDNPFAADVNGSGQVLVNAGPGLNFPYVWQNGTLTSVALGGYNGTVWANNETGAIVGALTTSSGARAFLLAHGVLTNLGVLGTSGQSAATGINNFDQVVGLAIAPGTDSYHAVQWNSGVIADLGTLPNHTQSRALAINDVGQVVGFSGGPAASRPVLWQNGVPSELDVPSVGESVATDINNAGDIVGYGTRDTFANEAFLLRDGVLTNLNLVVGSSSCRAKGINDTGQIAVECDGQVFRLTPTQPGTDVGVAMVPATPSATVASPFTYEITVSNVGALPASGVVLTDVLPAGASFVSIAASQGSCGGDASIVCALGELAGGASASLQLTVTPTVAGTLTNRVAVTINEADANDSNNSASVSVTVRNPVVAADVGVTMTDSPDPVRLRALLTYTITVTNAGPGAATSVSVRDRLPSSLSLVSLSSSQGTCSGPGYLDPAVTCSLGSLAVGATATATVVTKPGSTGTLSNTATVTVAPTDNNTANNSATAITTVRRY